MSSEMRTIFMIIALGIIILLFRFLNQKWGTPKSVRPKIKFTGKMNMCKGSGHNLANILTVIFGVLGACAMVSICVTNTWQDDLTLYITMGVNFCVVGLGMAIIILRHLRGDYIAYNDEGFTVKAWRDKSFSATGQKQSFLWSELRDVELDGTELTIVFEGGKCMKVYHLINCQPFVGMARAKIASHNHVA